MTKKMKNKGNYYNKEKKNKSLEDYKCWIDSSKQPSDFEVTTNFVMNHTQENFDRGRDMSEALRTLINLDTDLRRTTKQVSEADDEVVCDRENIKFEFDHKGESANYHKRMREHEKT